MLKLHSNLHLPSNMFKVLLNFKTKLNQCISLRFKYFLFNRKFRVIIKLTLLISDYFFSQFLYIKEVQSKRQHGFQVVCKLLALVIKNNHLENFIPIWQNNFSLLNLIMIKLELYFIYLLNFHLCVLAFYQELGKRDLSGIGKLVRKKLWKKYVDRTLQMGKRYEDT